MKYPKVTIMVQRAMVEKYYPQLVESIVKFTRYPNYDLIVYKDSSGNVTKGWNTMVKMAQTEYMLIMNDDMIVTKGWLTNLMQVMLVKKDEKVATVSPTISKGATYLPELLEGRFNINIDNVHQVAQMIRDKYKGVVRDVNCFPGSCFLFTKKVWKEAGGFNEKIPMYANEVEFAVRLQCKGWKFLWRMDTYVHHYGEASIRALSKTEEEYKRLREEGSAIVRSLSQTGGERSQKVLDEYDKIQKVGGKNGD